jgi:transcriptional regulator with XRE-family HTH domain
LDTNIKALRDHKGLSLAALSDLTGINKGTLSRIERGIYHPDNLEVELIHKALGAPIEMWISIKPRKGVK